MVYLDIIALLTYIIFMRISRRNSEMLGQHYTYNNEYPKMVQTLTISARKHKTDNYMVVSTKGL